MTERDYFTVSTESPVMKVIEEVIEREKQFQAALGAIEKKYGADGCWVSTTFRRKCLGLQFETLPKGWKKNKKGVCTPLTTTPDGKAIAKELEDIPYGVAAATFSAMLHDATGPAFTHWVDGHVYWSTFDKLADQYILSVPAGCKASPPGCQKLKMSEYWQLKEAHPEIS